MFADGEEDVFAVWPENARAINAFLVASRLWRVGALGGVLGFDYQQIEAKLRMKKIKVDADLIDDLEVMELGMMASGVRIGGAMDVLNAK
jgi:hypothetical protein